MAGYSMASTGGGLMGKLIVICDNEARTCNVYQSGDGVVVEGDMAIWRTLLVIQEFMNSKGLPDKTKGGDEIE